MNLRYFVCSLVVFFFVSTISCRPYKDVKTRKDKNIVNIRDIVNKRGKPSKSGSSEQTTLLPEESTPTLPTTEADMILPTATKESNTLNEPVRCDAEARAERTFSSCKSLKKVLTEHIRRSRQLPSRRLDTSYNAFTLNDLFYSGILDGTERIPSEALRRDQGVEDCDLLLKEWLRPQSVNSGLCSWHYTCSYDSSRFPGFTVEAVIDNPANLDADLCQKVKMKYVTVFERTTCEEDPCRMAENWVTRSNQEIVVGFQAVS